MADLGRHDDRLLDALEQVGRTKFSGPMWRVVREGRSPLDGSRGAGRWNPADLSVLYGAEEADGALAEINFHISRNEPVFPSRMRHEIIEMRVSVDETLNFVDLDALAALAVDRDRYKEILYGRTQEIAAAAAYMGFQGIVAPSARWNCQNIVLFLDILGDIDEALEEVSCSPVDWAAWRKTNIS